MSEALEDELKKLTTSNIDGGERGAGGSEIETYDFVRSTTTLLALQNRQLTVKQVHL